MANIFTNTETQSEYIQRKKNINRSNFLKTISHKKNYKNRNFKTRYSTDLNRNKFIYFKNKKELLQQTKGLLNDVKYCKNPILDICKNNVYSEKKYIFTTSLHEASDSIVDNDDIKLHSKEKSLKKGIFQRRGILENKPKNPCFKIHPKYR